MKVETKEKRLEEVLKGSSFEDYTCEGETADEVIESLQEQISQDEIIYYSNAIEYLKENDASLNESLEIAEGMGYSPKDLSSEILATLLYQQNLNEELGDLTSHIEGVFEE